MTISFELRLHLESDATFGRGDGVAGLVDQEVEHDALGLPYLRGRTLKGLLEEECANVLYALENMTGRAAQRNERWWRAAQRLFGAPGSKPEDNAAVSYGDAQLPADVRTAVNYELNDRSNQRKPEPKPVDILASLTAIRRQTAMDPMGVPVDGSLRSMRVILRSTPFDSEITFREDARPDDLALLAACVKGLRRAGTGRNRGRGKLKAVLCDANGVDITDIHFKQFQTEVAS